MPVRERFRVAGVQELYRQHARGVLGVERIVYRDLLPKRLRFVLLLAGGEGKCYSRQNKYVAIAKFHLPKI
jgi:hypothetical protein